VRKTLSNIKRILSDQSGMQAMEAVGLAVIGLIAVAIIYNMTRGGFDSTTGKLQGVIQDVNDKLE
jgi:Flp pilus assembly pilin Flp